MIKTYLTSLPVMQNSEDYFTLSFFLPQNIYWYREKKKNCSLTTG